MIVTLVTVLTFLPFSAGVAGPSQRVEAVEGDDVTLQCPIVPGVDLSAHTVDISKQDQDVKNDIVHAYVHGRDHFRPQMSQYRDRTALSREDLTRGLVKLKISSVTPADGGRYEVFLRDLNAECVIDLTVVSEDEHNRSDDSTTPVPPEEEVTESDGGAAAKNESALAPDGGVGGVRGVRGIAAAVVFVAACGLLGFLVKRQKIKIRKKTPREINEQEEEKMMKTNSFEMKSRRAAEGGGDRHGAAENGLIR
ncbi:uncharacterized protein LOC121964728 [Plectropomus leopardus]|uniref:uncharacterized protein LOC121964728 n=1 Tax=Plectropomus leopardus TaxID=160734 RepID=UPI001C4C01A6|nr:uncharacterized protein LOC121964728 [Plectropomus leopardus]